MSIAIEIISQLSGDQRWYSVGAMTMTLKRDKRAVSRQVDSLVGVTLKQRQWKHGFVYAHRETPDDAEVVYVRMVPQLAIDSYGRK